MTPILAFHGVLLTCVHRPVVFEHISGLLKAPERFGIILIERAVVGLLRLGLILAEQVSLVLVQ